MTGDVGRQVRRVFAQGGEGDLRFLASRLSNLVDSEAGVNHNNIWQAISSAPTYRNWPMERQIELKGLLIECDSAFLKVARRWKWSGLANLEF
jgi:hypothetical protein